MLLKTGVQVTNPVGYKYLKMLHAMNFTIPGVPCIYYGDEYGQPGANDPDNRRWMQFKGLLPGEQDVLATTVKLARMHNSSMPLIYGDYKLIEADKDVLAYFRTYMGETVVTVLNKGEEARRVDIALPCGLTCNGKNTFSVDVDPVSYVIIK